VKMNPKCSWCDKRAVVDFVCEGSPWSGLACHDHYEIARRRASESRVVVSSLLGWVTTEEVEKAMSAGAFAWMMQPKRSPGVTAKERDK